MNDIDLALADVLAGAHGALASGNESGYTTMKKIHDGARAELAQLRAIETCTGCGSPKLSAILAVIGGAAACCQECSTLSMDERNAIREAMTATRTAGTALAMLATVEHDDRLRAIEEVLPQLRARLAAAEAPKTCATCAALGKPDDLGRWFCHGKAPVTYLRKPDNFGCIHHAPAAAADTTEKE